MNAIDSLEGGPKTVDGQPSTVWTLADSWICARLQQLIRDVERLFQNFQYGEAGRQVYEFIWNDFADWYVEIAKEQLKNEDTKVQTAETLARVLDISLRLLHPFMPFVTEEIWNHLRAAVGASSLKEMTEDWPEALIIAPWPEPRPVEGWEEPKTAGFTFLSSLAEDRWLRE